MTDAVALQVENPLTVCYVAKHDSGGNDDEGAITQAFLDLGHNVERLRESRGQVAHKLEGDFLLFHKWEDLPSIARIQIPKVCWYFDLVDWPDDPTVADRCKRRLEWMDNVIPLADLAFLTDGDRVEKCNESGKLHWLPQGADLRVMGFGEADERCCPICRKWWTGGVPILFTGNRRGGKGRQDFVHDMEVKYGPDFLHIADGVHGRDMANLIASCRIVVAPDSPVTDRYWSNRVYNALGFGAFLIHPYCAKMTEQYDDHKEIVFYRSRGELHEAIRYYWGREEDRLRIAKAGLNKTLYKHTYAHRVAELVRIVRERLLS